MTENSSTTLRGTVEKIITSRISTEPEKALISIEGADQLYKELRIENTLADERGKEVHLKQGDAVEVTIEVEPQPLFMATESKD